ncbi:MAG: LON peptidase substrate-binding domain-containing protein, partial [Bacteroidales bacterium]|nr:LON peptidase substrate-binding domain-containing protein [Bacteroidales bacterium]
MTHSLNNIFNLNAEAPPLNGDEEAAALDAEEIPSELPILSVRNMVLFPGMVLPITVSRPKSSNLIRAVGSGSRILGVVAQKDVTLDDPEYDDLYKIGTMAHILKVLELNSNEFTILLQGKRKIALHEVLTTEPYFTARVSPYLNVPIKQLDNETFKTTLNSIRNACMQIFKKMGIPATDNASFVLNNIKSPTILLNYVASNLDLSIELRQKFLEYQDLSLLAKDLLAFLSEDLQKIDIK